MKKKFMFAVAAVVALGMTVVTSCSKTEGENAAVNESVEDGVDNIEATQEAVTEMTGDVQEVVPVDANAPAVETVTVEEVQGDVPAAAAAVGDAVSNASSTVGDKVKDAANAIGEKAKEAAKDAADKTKDAVNKEAEKLKEKGADAVNNALQKGKDALENLKK